MRYPYSADTIGGAELQFLSASILNDGKRAIVVCRLPAMYLVVESIKGRRLLQVGLLRDTSGDENPSVRCQQAVFMLPHNHVSRRWATHRNKSPAAASVVTAILRITFMAPPKQIGPFGRGVPNRTIYKSA